MSIRIRRLKGKKESETEPFFHDRTYRGEKRTDPFIRYCKNVVVILMSVTEQHPSVTTYM